MDKTTASTCIEIFEKKAYLRIKMYFLGLEIKIYSIQKGLLVKKTPHPIGNWGDNEYFLEPHPFGPWLRLKKKIVVTPVTGEKCSVR